MRQLLVLYMCCMQTGFLGHSYRSSILTGKYVHNHHTYTNVVERGCDAPSWRAENEHKTIGYYMHQAGYSTALFGMWPRNGLCRPVSPHLPSLLASLQANKKRK